MYFELLSEVSEVVVIASGRGIRDLARLRRQSGPGRWRKLKGIALVRLRGGRAAGRGTLVRGARCREGQDEGEEAARRMSAMRRKQYLLCVRNSGCEDLELRKLYVKLSDAAAAREGFVRVVDESGEDYLYPAVNFVPVRLPLEAERALARRMPVRASNPPMQRPAGKAGRR